MLLIKDFDLRNQRLLSRSALDLFYKLNHIAFSSRTGLSVSITIYDLTRALDCSMSTVIRAKNELLEKGYLSQTKTTNNKCVYTLNVLSYDLFLSNFVSCPHDKFFVGILELVGKEYPELTELADNFGVFKEEEINTSVVGADVSVFDTEDSEVETEVPVLVACAEEHRIPKPIQRVGRTVSQTFTDNSSPSRERIHPFVDWVKPIDDWNAKDFVEYFQTCYIQTYGTRCTGSKIAAPTMAREAKRLGNETLKKQIKLFFEFCKQTSCNPSWEIFASANVQQKLDHFRVTGELPGYGGKIQNQAPIISQAEKDELREIRKQVSDILWTIRMYKKQGDSIFTDPEIGEESRRSRDIAVEKGYALFKRINVQTEQLTDWLKALGLYEEGMENVSI